MEVLKNRTAKSTEYYSRYNGFSYYYNELDGKNQMATSAWLDENNTSIAHTVQKGDTWDSIALKYYGNPTYYWLICDFNRVVDPFILPKVGEIVYVPTLGKNVKFKIV